MKPNKTKIKRDMRSFEADDDVAKMLDAAIAAGQTAKELTNLAIRKHGPEILRGMVKEMREQAAELEKKIPASKH